MLYHLSRNGQTYGPYTREDIERYVASGNILLTDLAKSDDMAEWLPVSHILSGAPTPEPVPTPEPAQPYTQPAATYPAQYAPVSNPYPTPAAAPSGFYPDPPDLAWGLLLLFGLLTCGIFSVVYDFIQAAFVKKLLPTSKVLTYLIVLLVMHFVNAGGSFGNMMFFSSGLHGPRFGHVPSIFNSFFSFLIGMAVLVLSILYRFSMKADLEEHYNTAEPIGLRLGPIMTFFFGGLYFQYHFNRINVIKQAARFGAPRPY